MKRVASNGYQDFTQELPRKLLPRRAKDDVRTSYLRRVVCGTLAPASIWKGLITQRSLVQIQPPQPWKSKGFRRNPGALRISGSAPSQHAETNSAPSGEHGNAPGVTR